MKSKVLQISFTTICLLCAPIFAKGPELSRDPLFHIERNKNANIIQYDAQLQKDGTLDLKKPVIAYWIRLANEGEIKKLTWIQRRFAFGVKAKTDKTNNVATMKLAVNIGRTMLVKKVGDDYRAITDINGTDSYIEKVFIQARGRGLLTRVDYIEVFGVALDSHEKQYERFVP